MEAEEVRIYTITYPKMNSDNHAQNIWSHNQFSTPSIGFEGDGFKERTGCTNVDECQTGTHNCHEHAACTDNHGVAIIKFI